MLTHMCNECKAISIIDLMRYRKACNLNRLARGARAVITCHRAQVAQSVQVEALGAWELVAQHGRLGRWDWTHVHITGAEPQGARRHSSHTCATRSPCPFRTVWTPLHATLSNVQAYHIAHIAPCQIDRWNNA